MRYLLLFAAALILTTCSFAQELNGRWVGNYTYSDRMSNPEKVVVELLVTDSIVSGSSHLYYIGDEYEHYTIKGKYRRNDSTIYFYEDSTLGVKLGFGVDNCLGNYKMKLRIRDSAMRFEGRWKDNDPNGRCPALGVWLSKGLPPKPLVPVVREKDKNLERPIVSQSLIEISPAEKDNIKIEVLDNSLIDNDAVSIYVNDEPVSKKQLLSREPIVFYVSVSKERPLCRIVMAAESMGSVPPCTALMRVTVNGKVHNATLSSNMGTSGSLELFLKE
jgi:hypothetical protein